MNINKHLEIIKEFLNTLSQNNYAKDNFTLKGGTALLMCYGLDRFSTDIDLDSTKQGNIENIVRKFCNEHNYLIAENGIKDTNYGQRFKIHYDINEPNLFLKIETSKRTSELTNKNIVEINNIKTYSIDKIMNLKLSAFNGRDKIRDLYDIVFIYKNYSNDLKEETIDRLKEEFSYKNFDYVLTMIETMNDEDKEIIDIEKLENDYLEVCSNLDIEPEEIESSDNNSDPVE